jgi:hypothetical protein
MGLPIQATTRARCRASRNGRSISTPNYTRHYSLALDAPVFLVWCCWRFTLIYWNETKAFPFHLIKKKRVARLIMGNRTKTDTTGAKSTQNHPTKMRRPPIKTGEKTLWLLWEELAHTKRSNEDEDVNPHADWNVYVGMFFQKSVDLIALHSMQFATQFFHNGLDVSGLSNDQCCSKIRASLFCTINLDIVHFPSHIAANMYMCTSFWPKSQAILTSP